MTHYFFFSFLIFIKYFKPTVTLIIETTKVIKGIKFLQKQRLIFQGQWCTIRANFDEKWIPIAKDLSLLWQLLLWVDEAREKSFNFFSTLFFALLSSGKNVKILTLLRCWRWKYWKLWATKVCFIMFLTIIFKKVSDLCSL